MKTNKKALLALALACGIALQPTCVVAVSWERIIYEATGCGIAFGGPRVVTPIINPNIWTRNALILGGVGLGAYLIYNGYKSSSNQTTQTQQPTTITSADKIFDEIKELIHPMDMRVDWMKEAYQPIDFTKFDTNELKKALLKNNGELLKDAQELKKRTTMSFWGYTVPSTRSIALGNDIISQYITHGLLVVTQQ